MRKQGLEARTGFKYIIGGRRLGDFLFHHKTGVLISCHEEFLFCTGSAQGLVWLEGLALWLPGWLLSAPSRCFWLVGYEKRKR